MVAKMNTQVVGSENHMYNVIERINWHILLLRTSECNMAFLMTSILGWRFGGGRGGKPLIPAAYI